MKLTVNLASKPFVELKPLLLRLRIAMAALVLLAIVLGVVLKVESTRATEDSAAMKTLETKTQALLAEKAANERSMQQPVNASLLAESQFLNGLYSEKAFSWTEVLMDLEKVLPGGVQVTSIDPQIDKTGEVTLRLRVSGDRDKAVELVKNLEDSKHFRDARLADESTQSQDQAMGARMVATNANGVEFNIYAGYNPLPIHDVHAENAVDAANAEATNGKGGRR